jgi:hypothetical protein
MINLSAPNHPDQPEISEHDGCLWYSSIFTPEIEIYGVSGTKVNNIWDIPEGWTDIIARRLMELKERGW